MAIERVSTFNLFQTTLTSASKLQADLANLQSQISSGFKSQNFAGIADQSTQYMQLQDRLQRIDRYIANNKLIKTRLEVTDITLSQVIDTASDLVTLIQQYGPTQVSGETFELQLDNLWQTLTRQLNVSIDGRYLFSGTATSTPAVDAGSFPTLRTTGVPDDGYYLGNDQDLTVRPEDSISFTYNVRADAEGIQQIFAGLAMAKRGSQADNRDYIAQAMTLVQQGLQGVNNLRSQVNSNNITLDNVNTNLASLKVYWQGVTEEIGGADILSASTQVAINQGILQAAFQTFARITSLRLSDFLR